MSKKEQGNRPKLSDSLEEAAEQFARFYDNGTCDGIAQDCFIAGAEWQKEKDEKEQADLFTIVALDAVQRAKEQMLKDAVECVVMDFSSNLPRPQVDIRLDPSKYHSGDKVRIIIVKEDKQ